MGLLKRFGLGKDAEQVARILEHPRDLLPGDIIRFGFSPHVELSNEGFTIDAVETLDIGGDASKLIYLKMSGPRHKIRLRIVDEQRIEVALEVLPETLFAAFKEDDLAHVLAPDSGDQHHLKPRKQHKIAPALRPWVGGHYRQEAHLQAYLYADDYRDKLLPTDTDRGEIGCDYAMLMSDDREHSLEFRIYDGGRTESFLCAFLPVRKIEELWPGSSGSDR